MYNKYKQRFTIKKFTVGVASVFIGGTALMATDILPFNMTNVASASESTEEENTLVRTYVHYVDAKTNQEIPEVTTLEFEGEEYSRLPINKHKLLNKAVEAGYSIVKDELRDVIYFGNKEEHLYVKVTKENNTTTENTITNKLEVILKEINNNGITTKTEKHSFTLKGRPEERIYINDLINLLSKYDISKVDIQNISFDHHEISEHYVSKPRVLFITVQERPEVINNERGDVYIHFIDKNTLQDIDDVKTVKTTGDIEDGEDYYTKFYFNEYIEEKGYKVISGYVPDVIYYENIPKHYYLLVTKKEDVPDESNTEENTGSETQPNNPTVENTTTTETTTTEENTESVTQPNDSTVENTTTTETTTTEENTGSETQPNNPTVENTTTTETTTTEENTESVTQPNDSTVENTTTTETTTTEENTESVTQPNDSTVENTTTTGITTNGENTESVTQPNDSTVENTTTTETTATEENTGSETQPNNPTVENTTTTETRNKERNNGTKRLQKVKVNFVNSNDVHSKVHESVIVEGIIGNSIKDYVNLNNLNIKYNRDLFDSYLAEFKNEDLIVKNSKENIYEVNVEVDFIRKREEIDSDADTFENVIPTDPTIPDMDEADFTTSEEIESKLKTPIILTNNKQVTFTNSQQIENYLKENKESLFREDLTKIVNESKKEDIPKDKKEYIKTSKSVNSKNKQQTNKTKDTQEEVKDANAKSLKDYIPYAAGGIVLTGGALSGLHLLRRRGI